jgi:arylsulfatase A-like enzyme
MKIPFMIRWPGKIEHRHDELLFSAPDVYPTLMDLMGFSDRIPAEVEGRSYAERFVSGTCEDEPSSQLYLWVPAGVGKLPVYGRRGVRTERYTLSISTSEDGSLKETLLFDRQNDPNQMWNQADEKPELVRSLIQNELKPWLDKTNDSWVIPEAYAKLI